MTAEVIHAAAASRQPPASKARQNKMPLENGDSTNQEVRTTRKKHTANEVPKDPQDDSPDEANKAKGRKATEKRVQTNDHPGLMGKNVCRSNAEVAADKATKEAKAAIDSADDEKALVRLAEIELEQENTEKM
ncbi:hypothetical protein L208DRAFT_1520861 [Tricholoma matsutake]|nr:hypothetical protein L208DRAFT_1520861 [Tricholoma matsutake 945]